MGVVHINFKLTEIGVTLGEGYGNIQEFKLGVEECLKNYNFLEKKEAIEKIRQNHNLEKFINNMRSLIKYEVNKIDDSSSDL